MTKARYDEIMTAITTGKEAPQLTQAEIAEGYHYCGSWDGLLVMPDTPESECCECR